MKAKFKQTISPALLGAWKAQVRRGDIPALAKKLNVTQPTISKALLYGCVHQPKILEGITKYFEERARRENQAAQRLSPST